MPTYKKPTWVYQGKSTHQVIEELGTFENQDLEVFISIDYGENQTPLDAIKSKDGRYLILYRKKYLRRGRELQWNYHKPSPRRT